MDKWEVGLCSNNKDVEGMPSKKSRPPHVGVQKWSEFTTWQPPLQFGEKHGFTYKMTNKIAFNGKIWYRVLAMNSWRFQHLLQGLITKNCKICGRTKIKNVNHCLWHCPTVQSIWKWVKWMLQANSTTPGKPFHLTAT